MQHPPAERTPTVEDQYTQQDPRDQYQRHPDRKAVITGGDSGIGRAVAVAFAREGADVLLSYLAEEQDDAEKTAELVRQAGREAVLVTGDIQNEQHCGSR